MRKTTIMMTIALLAALMGAAVAEPVENPNNLSLMLLGHVTFLNGTQAQGANVTLTDAYGDELVTQTVYRPDFGGWIYYIELSNNSEDNAHHGFPNYYYIGEELTVACTIDDNGTTLYDSEAVTLTGSGYQWQNLTVTQPSIPYGTASQRVMVSLIVLIFIGGLLLLSILLARKKRRDEP